MNKKIIATLLGVATEGIMGYSGTALAEDAPKTMEAPTVEKIVQTAVPEASPQKKVSDYDSIKQRLEQAFKDSGECDKVYWVNFSGEDVLVCDEKDGDGYRQKYGINLNQICDVRLQENYRWYIFDWLGGDDVVVSTTSGDVYTMRFWDKDAKNVYTIIKEYLGNTSKTNNKCGVNDSLRSSSESILCEGDIDLYCDGSRDGQPLLVGGFAVSLQ